MSRKAWRRAKHGKQVRFLTTKPEISTGHQLLYSQAMNTIRTLALLAGVTLLSACSSLPLCGSPEARGQTCTTGWAGTLTEFNVTQPAPRNYIANPIPVQQPASLQPSFGNSTGEEYQTIVVNTPQGFVYRRCKVLNGQVVACL